MIAVSSLLLAAVDPDAVLRGSTSRLLDEWRSAPQMWNPVRREWDDRAGFGHMGLRDGPLHRRGLAGAAVRGRDRLRTSRDASGLRRPISLPFSRGLARGPTTYLLDFACSIYAPQFGFPALEVVRDP